jgi:hypothetical protein
MLRFFQSTFTPLFSAALGVFLLAACATGEIARGNSAPWGDPALREIPPSHPGGAENRGDTVPARYSQRLEIPLWEEAPPGLETGKIPVLTLSVDLLDPEITAAGGTGRAARDLERGLRDTFYRGLPVRDYAREQVRVQTLEYRDMGDEARHNPSLVNSATLNWSYEEVFETPVNGRQLLVISRSRSFYSGGAHPNHDRAYFVFDREAGMRIGLWDVVRKDSGPALRELINRELRLSKKIGPGDSLKKAFFLVDEAELTENFFFSPQGLGFHWDPYEIAPYAEGYVEVFLPYDEIWELLGPEGRLLAREFGAG